jgi:tetratricopeptide (TPR) repeat protein
MTMKRFVRAAFTTSLLCATASASLFLGAASAQAADKSDKVSAAVGKPLQDAAAAAKANDWVTAMADVKLAQAIPDPTPFDTYKINQFLAVVSINLKDYATATTATEAAADSPAMPDADKPPTYKNAFILASNAKQYDKAVAYAQDLIALGPIDDAANVQLAIDYYEMKDIAHAQQYAQKAIDDAKAAGQTPDANALRIVMSGQVSKNNQAGAEATLEAIVLADPDNSADSWRQLVDVAIGTKGLKDMDAIYLFRLKLMAGAMTAADDYTTLAGVAAQKGFPTEAQAVLEKGIASGKLSSGQAGELLAKSRKDAAADARQLPQIVASAEKSKSGEQDLQLGEDYWGYGRFADAEAAARRAIAKDGMKDPGQGQLLLGATLAAQGKYDEAAQTLGQVNGSAAKMKVAHLWSLYAQAKLKKAPASPAPASPPAH